MSGTHLKIYMKIGEHTSEQRNPGIKKTTRTFVAHPERTIEWLGGVNHDNLERTLAKIKDLMVEDSSKEIHLLVNSSGGATGIGMAFYDAMNFWLKPKLVTIGSGDVDSSGLTIFLSGEKRYLTRNTTLLLHLAGRTFEPHKRFTVPDMDAMIREDKLKDYQYACVVSDATHGRYSPEHILDLMAKNTILTPEEAVNMGLAHKVLK
jgi:ATP-dependent protease ClpP protease subunit